MAVGICFIVDVKVIVQDKQKIIKIITKVMKNQGLVGIDVDIL